MEKLVVGLTNLAMKNIVTEMKRYNSARSKLYQHKILMSDTIMEGYRAFFEDTGDEFLFMNWFRDFNRTDDIEYRDPIQCGDEDEIVSQMKSISKNMVVALKEEARPDGVTPVILEELDSADINTPLDRYCIPFNAILPKGTPNNEFFDWLRFLLAGENKVTIIDSYLCKDTSRGLMSALLMPSIPPEAKVHMYCSGSFADQQSISYFKKTYKNLTIHPSDPKDMHDRYVFCSSFVLSIGAGFDVFDSSAKKTRKETGVSLTNSQRPNIPAPYK